MALSDDDLRRIWRDGMRSTGPRPEDDDHQKFDAGIRAGLRAVAVEVAATTLEQFADTLGVDAGELFDPYWDGYRNGQRQALRAVTERAAAIRSTVSA